jgi:hypothetical protein
MRLSFPWAKNPMLALSGDQNGNPASSVPGIGRASNESIGRTKSVGVVARREYHEHDVFAVRRSAAPGANAGPPANSTSLGGSMVKRTTLRNDDGPQEISDASRNRDQQHDGD